MSNQFLERQSSINKNKLEHTISSVEQGLNFNPEHQRFKLNGINPKTQDLISLREQITNQKRICGRFGVSQENLEKIIQTAQRLGFKIEYKYKAGLENMYILGVGINCPNRPYNPSQNSKAKIKEEANNPANQERYDWDFNVTRLKEISNLNLEQKIQLTHLLQQNFGASWNLNAVNSLNSFETPHTIILSPEGDVVSFAMVDFDHTTKTAEITEVCSNGYKEINKISRSRIMLRILQEKIRKNHSDYTTFLECNMDSGMWKVAIQAGYKLCHQDNFVIPSNVKVNGKLRNFAVMVKYPIDKISK
jgi:hypothetical protein